MLVVLPLHLPTMNFAGQEREPEHWASLSASLKSAVSPDMGITRQEGAFTVMECQKVVNKYDSLVTIQLKYHPSSKKSQVSATEEEEGMLGRVSSASKPAENNGKVLCLADAEDLVEFVTGDIPWLPVGSLPESLVVERVAPKVDDSLGFLVGLKPVGTKESLNNYDAVLEHFFIDRGTQVRYPLTCEEVY